jgi:hypothetical protein
MATVRVPVREFRSGLASFIDANAPVAVTRHGNTVGFFIPTPGTVDTDAVALSKAAAKLDRLLTGKAVKAKVVAAKPKPAQKAKPVKRGPAR